MDTYDYKSAIQYYSTKIRETKHPYYYYYLADTQARAGLTSEALQTVDNALLLPNPFRIHFP
ncbi:MAG: hypothetical protein ACQEWV_24645 [Bacillota bacterium]